MSQLPTTARGRHDQIRQRKAAAAVEFALVLPLMVLIVMGVLVLAQLIYFRKSLVIAAAEGIRVATDRTTAANDVETRVAAILAARRIDNAQVAVTPTELHGLAPGTRVTIRVTAPFQAFGMSFLGLDPGTMPAVEASILRE